MSCFLVGAPPSLGCVCGDLRWFLLLFCFMGWLDSVACDWCCTLEMGLCLMYNINRVFEYYVGKFVQKGPIAQPACRKEVFQMNAQLLYASMVMIITSYLEIAVEGIGALMGN